MVYYKDMQMFDAVTIGDSVVDVFISVPSDPHVAIEGRKAVIEIGAKIPVKDTSFSLGGNATHVAIGLSRLGFRTALAAELGTDEFAEKILRDLEREKVAKNLLKQTPNALSAFTVSLSLGGDRTTFIRHIEREHNFSLDNFQTQLIYLTSMGEKWEEMYAKTLEFVEKTGVKLAFNPGSTQLKKGVESFMHVIKKCDVLFVNKEEAEVLLHGKEVSDAEKESAESLLFRLNRMGPKVVVITDGENGSYAIDEQVKVYTQPAFREKVTEKTGAGDGFSAGFLAGLLSGKNIQECLLWGTANAAGVVSKHGGQEGLLTKPELEFKIRENT